MAICDIFTISCNVSFRITPHLLFVEHQFPSLEGWRTKSATGWSFYPTSQDNTQWRYGYVWQGRGLYLHLQ